MLKVSYDCKNNSSLGYFPELEFIPFEDLEEWNRIKVYDRSNSERKQLYYKNTYICSCSSEEIPDIKTFIVECLLSGFSIERIKKLL